MKRVVLLSAVLAFCLYADEVKNLNDMTVTAQKTEESVQDVPISMSVFDDMKIEDAGITDITDLTYFAPNVYSTQNTNLNTIIIRGISSHAVALNTPVGLFIDDIGYPMTYMQNPDLLNVQSVEILRGPQGTLYGRNTEAGVIKVTTKQPNNKFGGKVFFETGIFDTPYKNPLFYRMGASASGPIIKDKLYLGVAFQSKYTDGYFENELKNNKKAAKENHKTGQVKLRWTPSENTDITLLVNKLKDDNGYGKIRYINGKEKTDRYKIRWDGANLWEDENNGQALKIEHTLNDYKITSITTSNDFKTIFDNDGEFGSISNPDQKFLFEKESLSQELRFSSQNKEKFKWLLGAYLFKDENHAKAEFFGQRRLTDFDEKGYAFFTQGTYSIFNDLHLTAGLRYDYEKAEGTQTNNASSKPYSKSLDSKEILPKLSISYDITEDIMSYVSVSKGFLAGGYNYAFANDSENLTFDPEFTWNYEAGFKTSWFDKRLMFNVALFHIDIKDKQVMDMITPTRRKITNAAEATSQGAEIDFIAQPNSSISIFGGFGITDSKIDKWDTKSFDYKDKKLPFSPKYTYNLGLKYLFSGGYYAKTDIVGIGDFYTNPQNTKESKIDGYNIVNLGFGYYGKNFEIAIWAKNLFDKKYSTNKTVYWNDTIVEDGQPRTIGLTVSYNF